MKSKRFSILIVLFIVSCLLFISCDDIPSEIKGNDNEYGVKIEGGGFDNKSTLVVNKVEDSNVINMVTNLMTSIDYNKEKGITIFDISVMKDEIEIQPNGKVKITIPLPAENADNYIVYHVGDDGTIENLTSVVEKGFIIFETESFSYFVLVEKQNEHSHSYGEWEYVDEVMHAKKCACDDIIREEHDFDEGVVTKDATEAEAGEKVYTCKICKGTKKVVLEKLSHTHNYGEFEYVDEVMHAKKCACDDIIREKHDFDEGVVTKDATEAEAGEKVYTCKICKGTKKVVLEKLSHTHNYGEWEYKDTRMYIKICACGDSVKEEHEFNEGVVTKVATEAETGEKVYTCKWCNGTSVEVIEKLPHVHKYDEFEYFDETYHKKSCNCLDEIKEEHEFDEGVVTKDATEEVNGEKVFTCKICKGTKTISIPKLPNVCDIRVITNDKNLGLIMDSENNTYEKYEGVVGTGTIVLLNAYPLAGAEFVGWYLNNNKYDEESLVSVNNVFSFTQKNTDYDLIAYFKKVDAPIENVIYEGLVRDDSLYNGATSMYVDRRMFIVDGNKCEDITLVKGISCVWVNADTGLEVNANSDPTLDDPYILAPALVGNYNFVVRYTNISEKTIDVCTIEGFRVVENYFKRISSVEELDYSGSMTHYAIVGEVNEKLYAMHFPDSGDCKAIEIKEDENGVIALGDEYSYIFRLYNYNNAVRHYPRDDKDLSTKLYDFRLGSGPYQTGTLGISDLELSSPNGDSGIMFRFNNECAVKISQPYMTSGGNEVYIRLVYDEQLGYVFTTKNINKDTRESFPVYLYKEYVKPSPTSGNNYELTTSLEKMYDGEGITVNLFKDLVINNGETSFNDLKNIRVVFSDGKNEIEGKLTNDSLIGPSDVGEYKFIVYEIIDDKEIMVLEASVIIYDINNGNVYKINKELTKAYDGIEVDFNVYNDLLINLGTTNYDDISDKIRFVWRNKETELISNVDKGIVRGPSDIGDYTLLIEENTEKGYVIVFETHLNIYEEIVKPKIEITAKLDKIFDGMPVSFNAISDLIINDGKSNYFELEENIRFVWRAKGYEEIGKDNKGIIEGPTKEGEYELVVQLTDDFGYSYYDVASISFIIQELNTYTVVWKNGDIVLLTEEYEKGELPVFKGENPVKDSDNEYTYTFISWTPKVEEVNQDIEYSAVFEEKTRLYEIRWLNYDGTLLKTESLPYNHMPEYSGSEPSRQSDELYNYYFKDWSPSVSKVTENKDYTAQYTLEEILPEDVIRFGMYPQTLVTDVNLIEDLNSKLSGTPEVGSNNGWISYNYYKEDEIADVMWYIDVKDSDDNMYRGVYISEYRYMSTSMPLEELGSTISQKENKYNLNTVYWFKYEPIKWRILNYNEETKEAFVLSTMLIDSQQYYHNTELREYEENKYYYPGNYKESDIRKFLNQTFYNLAFSSDEKELIKITEVDNGQSSYNLGYENGFACENTFDKVFLLSRSDILNEDYGFSSSTDNSETRRIYGTDYAFAQGLSCGFKTRDLTSWYLRSCYPTGVYCYGVAIYGSATTPFNVTSVTSGVLPAMVIYLDK